MGEGGALRAGWYSRGAREGMKGRAGGGMSPNAVEGRRGGWYGEGGTDWATARSWPVPAPRRLMMTKT